MKLFSIAKDGGDKSTVTGYWLVEIKSLFSIVLLKFDNKSREAFHTHAFNCYSWVVEGELKETMLVDGEVRNYKPSLIPFGTYRDTFHKVDSIGVTWVLSFRGPWAKSWKEYLPISKEVLDLQSGRKVLFRRKRFEEN